jgi:hypothetical protein
MPPPSTGCRAATSLFSNEGAAGRTCETAGSLLCFCRKNHQLYSPEGRTAIALLSIRVCFAVTPGFDADDASEANATEAGTERRALITTARNRPPPPFANSRADDTTGWALEPKARYADPRKKAK